LLTKLTALLKFIFIEVYILSFILMINPKFLILLNNIIHEIISFIYRLRLISTFQICLVKVIIYHYMFHLIIKNLLYLIIIIGLNVHSFYYIIFHYLNSYLFENTIIQFHLVII